MVTQLAEDYKYGNTTIEVVNGDLLPAAPDEIILTNGRNESIFVRYTTKSSNTLSGLYVISGTIDAVYPAGSVSERSYLKYRSIPELSKAVITLESGGAGSGVWGSITGEIGNQTDLMTELNNRVQFATDTEHKNTKFGINNTGLFIEVTL